MPHIPFGSIDRRVLLRRGYYMDGRNKQKPWQSEHPPLGLDGLNASLTRNLEVKTDSIGLFSRSLGLRW